MILPPWLTPHGPPYCLSISAALCFPDTDPDPVGAAPSAPADGESEGMKEDEDFFFPIEKPLLILLATAATPPAPPDCTPGKPSALETAAVGCIGPAWGLAPIPSGEYLIPSSTTAPRPGENESGIPGVAIALAPTELGD
jgi:hypothetical protein